MMKTSTAIVFLVGIAIGGFLAGLMRYGNFLNIAPIGQIILVAIISAILLAGIGLYFHFKDYGNSY